MWVSDLSEHTTSVQVQLIVAGFGIDAVFRDPGSIDPERGSGTRGDRLNSFLGRDPVRTLPLPILATLEYGRTTKNKA
jgi:hypothetical protein